MNVGSLVRGWIVCLLVLACGIGVTVQIMRTRKNAEYDKALSLYKASKHDQAFPMFMRLAQNGHADALYYVGSMMKDGLGTPAKEQEGMSYILKAFNKDQPNALYVVGFAYINGVYGLPHDEARGEELYRKAMAMGNGDAAWDMAKRLYYSSKNDGSKLQEAVTIFKKFANAGDGNCMVSLADLHILGLGVEKDPDRARRLYRKAIDKGDTSAVLAAHRRLQEFDKLNETLKDDR